jgi:hypothetical protein
MYYLIELASLTLGTKVITPKFALFKSKQLLLKSTTIFIISFLIFYHIFLKKITEKSLGPGAESDFMHAIALATSSSVKVPPISPYPLS